MCERGLRNRRKLVKEIEKSHNKTNKCLFFPSFRSSYSEHNHGKNIFSNKIHFSTYSKFPWGISAINFQIIIKKGGWVQWILYVNHQQKPLWFSAYKLWVLSCLNQTVTNMLSYWRTLVVRCRNGNSNKSCIFEKWKSVTTSKSDKI